MSGSGRQIFLERWLTNEDPPKGIDLSSARHWAKRLIAQFAVQDWLVTVYTLILLGAVWMAPHSAERTMNLHRLFGLSALLVVTVLGVRAGLLGKGLFAAIIYRAGMLSVVLVSYFMLQGLLPVVSTKAYDAQLYALDLRLFGFEPALAFDQFVTPHTTEWFAFFYYSYFFLISIYTVFLLFERRLRLLADYAIAFMGVYCVAHILYMVVPGYGPFKFLSAEFQNPLPLGFWYQHVLDAVNSAGAQKDIFPSLHTAGPFTCFLFAFRHRKLSPYKYAWIPTAFFSANIIIATMFLRWHYVIDIIAGIGLSLLFAFAAVRITAWEEQYRKRRSLQPVWAPLWPKRDVPTHVPDQSPLAD